MYPRNFGSDKIVRTFIYPSCKLEWNIAFQQPARFGGKAESSLRLSLNFNVLTDMENRERATMATNFLGRKKFKSGGENMNNARGHQSEHKLQWKKKGKNEQEHLRHFFHKTCN